MTTNEYLNLPETVLPRELAFGIMHVRESPSASHQRMVGQLFVTLRTHLRSSAAGEVWLAPLDVILDEPQALVVQPDLFVLLDGTTCVVSDRVWGAPNLMIEVCSPQARVGDITRRLQWFATYGIRECWLVHQPSRAIEVIQFGGGVSRRRGWHEEDEAIVSAVLPEFRESFTTIDAA